MADTNELRGRRRRRLYRLLLAALAVALMGTVLYSAKVEPRRLVVTHTRIEAPLLPSGLRLRIAHITDTHWHSSKDRPRMQRAVRAANGASPELIVVTGDTVDQRASREFDVLRTCLGELRAPLGLFAVLGGHDEHAGAEQVTRCLSRSGIRVLRNEALPLHVGTQTVWLAGIRDNSFREQPVAPAVERIPEGAPFILLAHSPDAVPEAAGLGAGLVLSGHTHGGQIRLPLIGAPVVPVRHREFDQGLFRHEDTMLYVSRGLGTTGFRVRLFCPPEVAILEVEGADAKPREHGH